MAETRECESVHFRWNCSQAYGPESADKPTLLRPSTYPAESEEAIVETARSLARFRRARCVGCLVAHWHHGSYDMTRCEGGLNVDRGRKAVSVAAHVNTYRIRYMSSERWHCRSILQTASTFCLSSELGCTMMRL